MDDTGGTTGPMIQAHYLHFHDPNGNVGRLLDRTAFIDRAT